MSHRQLEDVARWTPLVILLYFTAQFLIRVALSGNLETDEAQFVGHTHLALGYGNSHPPLYNWLLAGALAVTGGAWPAAVALVKNLLLAGAYLLAFDTARRVTGRALTGLIVVASLLLLPQIVWKSQITLAHSVMVMFAVVAVLHALVCIVQREGVAGFVWLGLAASIGLMAKYNFLLMLAAALIAAFTLPAVRARVFRPKLALSAGLLAALIAPHLIWAAQNVPSATERMAKLERPNSTFGVIDVPYLGLDGLLSLCLAALAWAGPLLLVWFAARALARNEAALAERPHQAPADAALSALFARTALIGLGMFAAIVLAGDLHSVHERYLTPMLMPLPFWLAFAWPLEARPRAAARFLAVGATVAGLMVTAWPAWIAFGREQLAFPYDAFAEAVDKAVPGEFAVLAPEPKYAANVVIRLDRARMWEEGAPDERVLLVWSSRGGGVPRGLADRLGEDFQPEGPALALTLPYDNLSRHQARLGAQLYRRATALPRAAARSP